ncbi:hypothetical protein C8N35_10997 [Breoghania corrubedonensis]|uniref:Uncharacterized protein n=1 Tax=Breoghania corrubedonensis TaxID=665038 RepID=A0A2T5V4Y6_9HYPH|nr:hypothetical protein [Breoghania corrubedonensis]PTW58793.1 hypothetical protein C8N35_10997 [Breoghania corrubedonensis]
MATATVTSTGLHGGARHGLFRRALDRMVSARERQARRYVNGYLLSLDDATLNAYGYDRSELEHEGSMTFPY